MCLPFSCGGGGGDHDHDIEQAPQPPQPPRVYFPSDEVESQPYYKPSSVKEAHDHHRATNMMPAGVEGKKNGGARAAVQQGHVAELNNKNGGGRTTAAFGYSDDDVLVPASVGVVRAGRESAAGKILAPLTTPAPAPAPATQAFNKHRDVAAAQQAPHQRMYVSASPPRHHHGHGSSAVSHPGEATADNMKAPVPVLPMARRGGQDYYY